MDRQSILNQIASLPKGNITTKTINGKSYYYWQYSQDGKQHAKLVKGEELEILREQIALRKALEEHLASPLLSHGTMLVRTGEALRSFVLGVKEWKSRDCFAALKCYIHAPNDGKILILYGLRRSGKTTLIRQLIAGMSPEEQDKTAFIQVSKSDTLARLNKQVASLEKLGFRYLIIDEATLQEDFIDGAALFSDIYTSSGMKIILSGTDSLGFAFAKSESLYDRCTFVRTTYIPYREFVDVLGIHGIDEYIRFGGTMSLSMNEYEDVSTFATPGNALEYVDTAIASNIQHSLRNYESGTHFRHLLELYEHNELTGAIHRIIEDMNHRFVLDTLTRTFKSADLSITGNGLRKDREEPTDALDNIDRKQVETRIKTLLEIREKDEQIVQVSPEHVAEIQEYLRLLELIDEVDVISSAAPTKPLKRILFTQPGLRYAQAKAIVTSLMQDDTIYALGIKERQKIETRLLQEVKGRMLEDVILLQTKRDYPKESVFVMQFAIGEFDMVRFDPESASCALYEIKHSDKAVPEQRRHLEDKEKLDFMTFHYGNIRSRNVIYQGESKSEDGVNYLNVDDYLLGNK